MNYKALYRRSLLLLSQPQKAWSTIMMESPRLSVERCFVFPLMGLCGTAVLIGHLLHYGFANGGWWNSMMEACVTCVALLGCFYLSAWASNGFLVRYLKSDDDVARSRILVGYSMVVTFVLVIFTGLFPSLAIFRYVLQFYVLYVVWLGVKEVYGIGEDKRMTVTLVISALILLVPFFIHLIFDKLSTTVV